MTANTSLPEPSPRAVNVANKLHSATIHLLRRVRRHDPASGLSAARLSALSVIVFAGPLTMGELARAEQVQLPTISRLVQGLELDGLVRRETDAHDRRIVHIYPTDEGRTVLDEARQRRVHHLACQLAPLSPDDLAVLDRAADLLEQLSD